jgi:hypothetical protein
MRRKKPFKLGAYYYVLARGIEKERPFATLEAKDRFQKLLWSCNSSQAVVTRNIKHYRKRNPDRLLADIVAYAITDGACYLVLRERRMCGITEFMHKLLTAHAMYINKRTGRKGPLFANRYLAEECMSNEYLEYCFVRTHVSFLEDSDTNWEERLRKEPVWAKAILSSSAYSSYADYFGSMRPERTILSQMSFPHMRTPSSFADLYKSWQEFTDTTCVSPAEDEYLPMVSVPFANLAAYE